MQYIPYSPALDPLGAAFGGGVTQAVQKKQQQAQWNAFLDWIEQQRESQAEQPAEPRQAPPWLAGTAPQETPATSMPMASSPQQPTGPNPWGWQPDLPQAPQMGPLQPPQAGPRMPEQPPTNPWGWQPQQSGLQTIPGVGTGMGVAPPASMVQPPGLWGPQQNLGGQPGLGSGQDPRMMMMLNQLLGY